MLQSTTKPLRYLPLLALAVGTLVSAFCPKIGHADTIGNEKSGAIRLGIYYLEGNAERQSYSSSIGDVGLDYNIGEEVGKSRSVLSADYIQRTNSGSKIQIVPLTISEQYYHTVGNTNFTPYGEAGLGVYFVSLNDVNNINLNGTHSRTSPGAFLGGGIDINSSLFLDLRYNLIGTIQGDDPSGYQLTLGIRF